MSISARIWPTEKPSVRNAFVSHPRPAASLIRGHLCQELAAELTGTGL